MNGHMNAVAYPGILFGGSLTNSVEDRGQRERGSGGSSPLVRGSGGNNCEPAVVLEFYCLFSERLGVLAS